MESVLDISNSYLRIFNSPVKIDKTLPKWAIIEPVKKKDVSNLNSNDFDGDNISLDEFLNMDKSDFNIYLGKRIRSDLNKLQSSSVFDILIDDSKTVKEEKGNFVIKSVKRYFRKWLDDDKTVEAEEEVFEFDIFEFFNRVKLTAKDNQSQYALRVEPYMIALKQAHDMGQQALADKLTAELFNNKYESILYAEGFHFKITEEQIVEFIKKTEKGVQLCYVSNFIRPIPEDVIALKKKADSLMVFDNYCVMFYDPEQKSFKQTEKEKEQERRKKSDPILFGMINGSRNLYYVADWIDEYCDLTLDEFIKVSGIEKKKLEIDEKIKL